MPAGHLLELRRLVGSRPLFSVGAGVCLLDHAGRVLLQQRSDNGLWGIPGGSAELGETLLDAARRELREETGLTPPPGAFELLDLYSGPQFYYRYPNGDEVYYVGAVYLARLPASAAPTVSDDESLALAFFGLDALPTLSGPIEHAALASLRAHLGLPPAFPGPEPATPARQLQVGRGYMRELRDLIGSRPIFAVGAAILVFDSQGRVLLQRRADHGLWGIPGGGSELGETFEDTARRELYEETSLNALELRLLDLLMGPRYFFEYPHGDQIHNVTALFVAGVFPYDRLAPPQNEAGTSETLELKFCS